MRDSAAVQSGKARVFICSTPIDFKTEGRRESSTNCFKKYQFDLYMNSIKWFVEFMNFLLISPLVKFYKKQLQLFTLYQFSFHFRIRMSWNLRDNRNLFLKLMSDLGVHHVELTTPKTSLRNLTLYFFEIQQLPDIATTDSIKVSCPSWKIYNSKRSIWANFKTATDRLNVVVYRCQNNFTSMTTDLKLTENKPFLAKRVYILSCIDVF